MAKFKSISEVTPHPAYWVNVNRCKGKDIYTMCVWGLGVTEKEFRENINFILANYTPTQKDLDEHPVDDLTPEGQWSKLSADEQKRISQNMYEMFDD